MSMTLRQNVLVLFLVNIGSAFNYLYQIVVGRSLSPEEYGVFNSLLSLAVFAAAPLTVTPLVMARFTITMAMRGQDEVRALLVRGLAASGLCGLVVLAAGGALAPLAAGFLHLERLAPFFITLAIIALSFVLPVPQGVLQGLQRMDGYGWAHAALTLGRLVAAVLLVAILPLGVDGALLAGVAGIVVSLAVEMLFLKDLARGGLPPLPAGLLTEMLRYSVPVFLSSTFITALGNLDLILVRHFCDPSEAGLYSSAAVFGRIAYFLPAVLANLLFPDVVRRHLEGRDTRRALWRSLGASVVLGGMAAGGLALFAGTILNLLLGPDYVEAAPLLRVVAVPMAMLAAVHVMVTHDLARGRHGPILVLGLGVVGMVLGIFFLHSTPMQVALVLLTVMAACFAAILAMILTSRERTPS